MNEKIKDYIKDWIGATLGYLEVLILSFFSITAIIGIIFICLLFVGILIDAFNFVFN